MLYLSKILLISEPKKKKKKGKKQIVWELKAPALGFLDAFNLMKFRTSAKHNGRSNRTDGVPI